MQGRQKGKNSWRVVGKAVLRGPVTTKGRKAKARWAAVSPGSLSPCSCIGG